MEVEDLTVRFPRRGGVLGKIQDYFTAVDGVSFGLPQGKILSIVGESGCGKTTLVKSLVGLVPMEQGRFRLFGEEVLSGRLEKSGRRVSDLVQMIFQDPYSSLNPRQTVSEILTVPLLARGVKQAEAEARAKKPTLTISTSRPHTVTSSWSSGILTRKSLSEVTASSRATKCFTTASASL